MPPIIPAPTQEPEATTVNGIGMWNQWTRNFKTPVLALLDLMDNAFDAACSTQQSQEDSSFQAHVHVYPDVNEDNVITGLVIFNNSPKHIKPMAQVLQVFCSSKGNASESIGENGVGLKQGCATLSDLSFSLSKNLGQYSLGILSKSLQRTNGCVLPSFSFPSFPTLQDFKATFQDKPFEAACIAKYGDGSLEEGIERLLSHYQRMIEMEDRQFVFSVVLHHLKHNAGASSVVVTPEEEEEPDSSDDEAQQQQGHKVDYAQNATGLMDKLKEELPRQYIHISSDLDVQVNGDKVVFSYWQRRMVELSSFQIEIDPKKPILNAEDWKQPANGYSLKIYCGFDPIRLNQSSKSPASLFVYSRQSGRLILHAPDCRSMLGLNASGTDYSQGLTIIVDDYHGNLPLSPTKQDLAFGEEAHGEVHQDNLYNWLSAVSKLFYKCHLGKMEKSKQKTLLTAEVKRHLATVKEAQKSKEIPKPLPECNLSTLVDIPWVIRNERVSTACRKESNYTYVTGEDTLITIREPQARVQPEKKKRTKKRKSLSAGEAESEAASVSASLQPSEDLLRDQDHKIHVLERSKKRLKKEFRGMLTKVEELREQNEALSAELSSNGLSRKSIASKQTRFSTINSKDQEELKAAKREIKELKLALKAAKERPEENEELEAAKRQIEELKQELKAAKERPAAAKTESEDEDELDAKAQIEELKRALKAAEERAEVAETETEIQQEIANELRKKSAELRRAAKHASP